MVKCIFCVNFDKEKNKCILGHDIEDPELEIDCDDYLEIATAGLLLDYFDENFLL